jgi:hypothetical protein
MPKRKLPELTPPFLLQFRLLVPSAVYKPADTAKI